MNWCKLFFCFLKIGLQHFAQYFSASNWFHGKPIFLQETRNREKYDKLQKMSRKRNSIKTIFYGSKKKNFPIIILNAFFKILLWMKERGTDFDRKLNFEITSKCACFPTFFYWLKKVIYSIRRLLGQTITEW